MEKEIFMRKKTYFEAYLDGMHKITIYFSKISYGGNSSFFYLENENHKQIPLRIKDDIIVGNYHKYECEFDGEIEFGKRYEVFHEYARSTPLIFSEVVKTKEFDEMFYYDGDDLGCTYTKDKTIFKLWAPTAYQVRLELEQNNSFELYEMKRSEKGVYEIEIHKDCYNASYVFYIEVNGKINKSLDPYGKGCTPNSKRSVVVDPSLVEMKQYELPEMKSYCDAIIYEASIRDYSQRGNILAFIQRGKNSILSYIKNLGMTHIQFLPLMDFKTVDDLDIRRFYNWGYDSYQWMCFEKSYSSNVYDAQQSLLDMADLVNACHEHGLRVNLDVVFNHVYDVEESPLQLSCPYYYFQYDKDREYSQATGCGNDVDSMRKMCRKIIVDTCVYLTKTFDIDGLRFDLMGILDIETMNEVVEKCQNLKADFMVYGEGWNMGCYLPELQRATQLNSFKMHKVAHFSDRFRDVIKGGTDRHQVEDKGYMLANTSRLYKAMNVLAGSTQEIGDTIQYANPTNVINFVECHDNMTCWDKINTAAKGSNANKRAAHMLCIAAVLLGQGIPFIHGGQEFARSKDGRHNTYNAPDAINKIDWRLVDKNQMIVKYVKELSEIRKKYDCLRFESAEDVKKNVQFEAMYDAVLKYHTKDEKDELCIYFNPTLNKYKITVEDGYEMIFYNQNVNPEKVNEFDINPQTVVILHKTL